MESVLYEDTQSSPKEAFRYMYEHTFEKSHKEIRKLALMHMEDYPDSIFDYEDEHDTVPKELKLFALTNTSNFNFVEDKEQMSKFSKEEINAIKNSERFKKFYIHPKWMNLIIMLMQ